MRDPHFPFSPFCFQKSAASWKPTGPGGLAGTRALADSGIDDRKEGDPRGGDGVWQPLAHPCASPGLCQTTSAPRPGCCGKPWAAVAILSLRTAKRNFGQPPPRSYSGFPIPGYPHHHHHPPPPQKSLCAPDVSRARRDTRPLLFAPPQHQGRGRRETGGPCPGGAGKPSKLRAAHTGCSARLCPTETSTAPRSARRPPQLTLPSPRRRSRARVRRPSRPREPGAMLTQKPTASLRSRQDAVAARSPRVWSAETAQKLVLGAGCVGGGAQRSSQRPGGSARKN